MVNQQQARARADLFNSGDTPNLKEAERRILQCSGEGKYITTTRLTDDEAKYLASKGYTIIDGLNGNCHIKW